MRKRRITIDPDAKEDLRGLYYWIVIDGSPRSAIAYIRRIQKFARSLNIATERGTSLDDVDPGLRAILFESVILAVRVRETNGVVARIFHHSQDWMKQLKRDAERAKALTPKIKND